MKKIEISKKITVAYSHIFKDKKYRPLAFFIIVGGLFSLAFVFIIPPLQGADESNHMLRSYQVSEGNLVSDYVHGFKENVGFNYLPMNGENVGGSLPTSLVKFTTIGVGNLPGAPNNKYDKKMYHKLVAITNDGTRSNAAFVNTTVYSPVAYAPDLPGIWLGRLLHVRPLVLMYMTRLSAWFIGLILFSIAIYITPFGRLAFAALALLPMTILQLSIVTADTMTLAMSFLAIAVTLKLMHNLRSPTRKDIALLFLCMGALSLTKPGLFLISFLTLGLLFNNNINRRTAIKISVGCILLSLVLAAAWNSQIKDLAILGYQTDYSYYAAMHFKSTANYNGQLHFILSKPVSYLRVLYESYLTTGYNSVVISFIGNYGWQDAELPLIFVVAGYVILALSVFISSQSENINQRKPFRYLAVLVALGIVLATATSVYLFTLPVGYQNVLGYMQGRYFIPVALLLAVAFMGGKKYITTKRYYELSTKVLASSTGLLAVMVFVVVVRYYNLGWSLK